MMKSANRFFKSLWSSFAPMVVYATLAFSLAMVAFDRNRSDLPAYLWPVAIVAFIVVFGGFANVIVGAGWTRHR